MTNKFIMAEMVPTISGIGGSFFTTASFKLDNIPAPFSNVPVNGVHFEISYGVETGGYKHRKPVTFDEKMDCSALKFEHAVSGFQIGGVPLTKETPNRHGYFTGLGHTYGNKHEKWQASVYCLSERPPVQGIFGCAGTAFSDQGHIACSCRSDKLIILDHSAFDQYFFLLFL